MGNIRGLQTLYSNRCVLLESYFRGPTDGFRLCSQLGAYC